MVQLVHRMLSLQLTAMRQDIRGKDINKTRKLIYTLIKLQ